MVRLFFCNAMGLVAVVIDISVRICLGLTMMAIAVGWLIANWQLAREGIEISLVPGKLLLDNPQFFRG